MSGTKYVECDKLIQPLFVGRNTSIAYALTACSLQNRSKDPIAPDSVTKDPASTLRWFSKRPARC